MIAMRLKEKIIDDMRSAMRSKEELRLSVLRMLLAAVKNREIEKRSSFAKATEDKVPTGNELTDEEMIAAVRSEAKKRKDAAAEFERGGRADLAEKEKNELAIIETYLPKELSDEEIEKAVQEVLERLGHVGPKDFGRVMGEAMKRLKGGAGGERVSAAVRRGLIG